MTQVSGARKDTDWPTIHLLNHQCGNAQHGYSTYPSTAGHWRAKVNGHANAIVIILALHLP